MIFVRFGDSFTRGTRRQTARGLAVTAPFIPSVAVRSVRDTQPKQRATEGTQRPRLKRPPPPPFRLGPQSLCVGERGEHSLIRLLLVALNPWRNVAIRIVAVSLQCRCQSRLQFLVQSLNIPCSTLLKTRSWSIKAD